MDDGLFPDYLKQYLKPENIELIDSPQRGLGGIYPNGVMFIGGLESLVGQVKTILHEVLHLHPLFIAYTGGLWQASIPRDEQIEHLTENHAQRVFRERKDVVDLVRECLLKARQKS